MGTEKPKHVWFFSGVDQFHLDDNLGISNEFGQQNFKYVPESELATLRAENERLREALEDVMLQDEYEYIRGGVNVKDWGLCGQIAKEALK